LVVPCTTIADAVCVAPPVSIQLIVYIVFAFGTETPYIAGFGVVVVGTDNVCPFQSVPPPPAVQLVKLLPLGEYQYRFVVLPEGTVVGEAVNNNDDGALVTYTGVKAVSVIPDDV
jgi:hypothetical protein